MEQVVSSEKKLALVCQCCGFAQSFKDGEDAFRAGWDCPPHFSGYVSCNLCPGSWIIMGETGRHAAAHERWKREGRPAEFEWPNDLETLG